MTELGGGMIAAWSLTIKDESTTFRRNSELSGIFESVRVQNLITRRPVPHSDSILALRWSTT